MLNAPPRLSPFDALFTKSTSSLTPFEAMIVRSQHLLKPIESLFPRGESHEVVALSILENLQNLLSGHDIQHASLRQKFALKHLHENKDNIFTTAPSNAAALLEWFLLFDLLFFEGRLKDYCKLEFVQKGEDSYREGLKGYTHQRFKFNINREMQDFTGDILLSTIQIFKNDLREVQKECWSFPITLLHEMGHAAGVAFERPIQTQKACSHGYWWQMITMGFYEVCHQLCLFPTSLDPLEVYDREIQLCLELQRWEKKYDSVVGDCITAHQIRGWHSAIAHILGISSLGVDELEISKEHVAQTWEFLDKNNIDLFVENKDLTLSVLLTDLVTSDSLPAIRKSYSSAKAMLQFNTFLSRRASSTYKSSVAANRSS